MTDRNASRPGSADKAVGDIRRATRRKFSAEEKIRIVLEGLRGEQTRESSARPSDNRACHACGASLKTLQNLLGSF